MSQVQSLLTPPPLRDAGRRAEADDKAADNAQFYHQLYHGSDASPHPAEDPPPPLEAPPGPPEVRGGYRRTGSNVYQLDDLWQKAPAHPVGKEQRPGRPRVARRSKQAAVQNHYRTGHVIATIFAALGWLMVGAGLAVSLISFFVPRLSVEFGLPNLLGGAAGALLVGLLTVALGLVARAQFDQANATLELVAMQQRAQSGPEHH